VHTHVVNVTVEHTAEVKVALSVIEATLLALKTPGLSSQKIDFVPAVCCTHRKHSNACATRGVGAAGSSDTGRTRYGAQLSPKTKYGAF